MLCVIENPLIKTTPVVPPPTVAQLQNRVVHHNDDGAPTSGGGGSSSTGYRSPASASTGFLAGDVAWTNTGFIVSSNNMYANASLAPSQTTQGLYAYNFGFSVPAGATINGIEATIEKTGPATVNDGTVMLTTDGVTTTGSNKAQGAWPGSEAVVAYGAANDLWGTSMLNVSMVNASAFGLVISAINTSSGAGAAINIDHTQIGITYTPAGGGSIYEAFGDLAKSLAKTVIRWFGIP